MPGLVLRALEWRIEADLHDLASPARSNARTSPRSTDASPARQSRIGATLCAHFACCVVDELVPVTQKHDIESVLMHQARLDEFMSAWARRLTVSVKSAYG